VEPIGDAGNPQLEIEVDQTTAAALSAELRQLIDKTGLSGSVRVEQ
jgi:hypothetical protein